MQPEERDKAYLWDMVESAQMIVEFTQGFTLEQFVADGKQASMVRLAVEPKLEILGEAARRISVFIQRGASGNPLVRRHRT
jgi:uncharacterized protein with HEPN domain